MTKKLLGFDQQWRKFANVTFNIKFFNTIKKTIWQLFHILFRKINVKDLTFCKFCNNWSIRNGFLYVTSPILGVNVIIYLCFIISQNGVI